MLLEYITLLFVVLITNVCTYISTDLSKKERQLADIEDCTSLIFKDYRTSRMVFFGDRRFDLGRYLFHEDSSVTQIQRSQAGSVEMDFSSLVHYSFYLFETSPNDLNVFEDLLIKLQESPYYNGSSITVVLYFGDKYIRKVFDLLWKVRLINSIVIDINSNIYTYKPITEGRCNSTMQQLVTTCREYKPDIKLFTESAVLYFPNCNLKVYAIRNEPHVFNNDLYHNEGLEIRILSSLTNALKLRLIYLEHNYTFVQLYQSVSMGLGDIALGGILLKRDNRPRTISPYFHIYMEMGFFVAYADPISPWKNIFRVFDVYIWFCIFTLLITVSVIWYYCSDTINRLKFHEYFYNVFKTFIGPSSTKVFGFKLNFIYSMWIWVSFLILNFYQCSLVSQLFNPHYNKQISTIRDLVESKLSIGGFTNFSQLMDPQSEDMLNIQSRYGTCSLDGIECMNRSFYQKDFAYFKNARSVIYQLKKLDLNLFELSPKIVIPSVMVMLKGSPFLSRFNVLIMRLQESGLVAQWDQTKNNPISDRTNEHPPIYLDQLRLIFIIYFIGISISIVIFVYEIWNQ